MVDQLPAWILGTHPDSVEWLTLATTSKCYCYIKALICFGSRYLKKHLLQTQGQGKEQSEGRKTALQTQFWEKTGYNFYWIHPQDIGEAQGLILYPVTFLLPNKPSPPSPPGNPQVPVNGLNPKTPWGSLQRGGGWCTGTASPPKGYTPMPKHAVTKIPWNKELVN